MSHIDWFPDKLFLQYKYNTIFCTLTKPNELNAKQTAKLCTDLFLSSSRDEFIWDLHSVNTRTKQASSDVHEVHYPYSLWLCYCEGKRERQGVRLLFYLPHNTVLIITLSKWSYEPELNFMWSVSACTTNVWAHLTAFMFLIILKTLKCTNVSGRLGIHFFKK